MQLAVVGEGVETIAQLRFLQSQGCETIQGFLASPPVKAAEMLKMARRAERLLEGLLENSPDHSGVAAQSLTALATKGGDKQPSIGNAASQCAPSSPA